MDDACPVNRAEDRNSDKNSEGSRRRTPDFHMQRILHSDKSAECCIKLKTAGNIAYQ